MADAVTTSSSGGEAVGAMADQYKAINEALDTAEKGLVEVGLYDAQTARALFTGIRPPARDNVVGNLADLQRQPLMPPGFEQGAMEGANPTPTAVAGAPAEFLGRTEAEKLADYGVELPETPATSDEAVERAGKRPAGVGGVTQIDDSGETTATTGRGPARADDSGETTTAESPQEEDNSDIENMTKAELQAYAEENGIQGVNQNSQSRDEMLAVIRGAS